MNSFELNSLTFAEKASIGKMAGLSDLQVIQLQKSNGNIYEAINGIAKGSVNPYNQLALTNHLNKMRANRGLRGSDEVSVLYENSTDAIYGETLHQGTLSPQSPEKYPITSMIQNLSLTPPPEKYPITSLIQNLSFTPPKTGSASSFTPTTQDYAKLSTLQKQGVNTTMDEVVMQRVEAESAVPTYKENYVVQANTSTVREVVPPKVVVQEKVVVQDKVVVQEKVPTWVWYAGGGAVALILLVLITSKK